MASLLRIRHRQSSAGHRFNCDRRLHPL